MPPMRRQVLLGTGVAIAGLSAVSNALGTQDDTPEITFGEINNEGEWLVLHNEEGTDINIENWYINWEDENENVDQWDQFQGQYGTTIIEAESSIKVATGAEDVSDADVNFERDGHVMNNDGNDVYALYLQDQQTEVANSEDDRHEATPTPTEEATPTPKEETPTKTEEETPTETEEETPTETEEEEETPTETEDNEETPAVEGGTFVAELSGEGHGIDTPATGRAEFEVDVDAEEVHYTLEVAELCDATMAHIHLGGEGESGPVVVWLYPTDQQEPRTKEGRFTGTLAEGTFTEDDLVGPLEGASFEELAETHADQEAYVNVHTEDHPSGEIRGQIEPAD